MNGEVDVEQFLFTLYDCKVFSLSWDADTFYNLFATQRYFLASED